MTHRPMGHPFEDTVYALRREIRSQRCTVRAPFRSARGLVISRQTMVALAVAQEITDTSLRRSRPGSSFFQVGAVNARRKGEKGYNGIRTRQGHASRAPYGARQRSP